MNGLGSAKKLVDDKSVKSLFAICWITYFSTYIGRLNFSASMGDIMAHEGFLKSELGVVAASFFFAYGIGQFISGLLGDRVSSRNLVFIGVLSSSLINLVMGMCTDYHIMAFLWFINGLAQSLTWSPIARLISDRLSGKQCLKASVNLSTTVPAGTLFTYFMCSQVIRFGNWRGVFFVASLIMAAISILWFCVITKLEKFAERCGEQQDAVSKEKESVQESKISAVLIASGLLFIVIAAMLHGVLKDGVMTWVPTYLAEIFDTSSSLSIQLTMVLPVINLVGVYSSDFLNKRVFKNELLTTAFCFAVAVAAFLALALFGNYNIVLSLILLGTVTTSMLGVNTMLVNIVPLYFKKKGKVSTVCGLLNSSTYVGSAASSYGTGVTAQHFGWAVTRIAWCVLAVIGTAVCIGVSRKWKTFSRK